MNQLNALYFDGISARGRAVRLSCEHEQLTIGDGELELRMPLAQVVLSPRLGRTRRQLMLQGGAVVELDDDPLLDDWFQASSHRRSNLLARLEAHWGAVLAAFVLVITLSAVLAIWGLPWMAQRIATKVPEQWVTMLGRGTLVALDKAFGANSNLPAERQAELRKKFEALAASADVDAQFQFRSWPRLGANALALPDGTIAVTDGLIALADDDRELIAVVAHELGHVHERHALQQVIAASGVAALVFVLTGDASGLGQIVVAAPTALSHMHHSRALESEADRFAFALLAKQQEDPAWFARIIRKLENAYPEKHAGGAHSNSNSNTNTKANANDQADYDAPGWLSSHPASEQRARLAEQFARDSANAR